MVDLPGRGPQHAALSFAPQAASIGLAITDVELIVEAQGIGPPGPPGPVVPAGGTYSVYGDAGILVGSTPLYNDTGTALRMRKVRLSAGISPLDGDLVMDVNKGGTTIFTDQSHRPRLTSGQTTSLSPEPDITTWGDGEYLTIDIDEIGTTRPGGNLTLTVVCV